MTASPPAPDLLYIMGTGRSGTTILEILLAAGRNVIGAGEVTHIFRDGFSGADRCACGEPAASCPVWSAVWAAGGWQQGQVDELAHLSRQFSWHSRFPLIASGLIGKSDKKQFADLNEKLFRAVADQTGAGTIVDSSKYAGRALALARYYPGKVRIICLTRSPQGLADAFSRDDTGAQKPKSPLATLLYYCYTTACFRLVTLMLRGQVFRVQYETLRAEPVTTLEQIAAWSGLDLSDSIDKIKNDLPFAPGHIVTGNRLRYQSGIKFIAEPQQALSAPAGAGWAVALMRAWRFLLRL